MKDWGQGVTIYSLAPSVISEQEGGIRVLESIAWEFMGFLSFTNSGKLPTFASAFSVYKSGQHDTSAEIINK